MPKTCWDCKFNTLKLKVLVPHNRTIKEYVHRTGDFQSDIVAVVKEKHGQCTVWFRSEGQIKLLTFKMLHVCTLEEERTKIEAACKKFELNPERTFVSNIIYSKMPMPEST